MADTWIGDARRPQPVSVFVTFPSVWFSGGLRPRRRLTHAALCRLYGVKHAHQYDPRGPFVIWDDLWSSPDAFLRRLAIRAPWCVPLWQQPSGKYDLVASVNRWAPHSLNGWLRRMVAKADRFVVLLDRAADLGARIDAIERRVVRHG